MSLSADVVDFKRMYHHRSQLKGAQETHLVGQ